MKKLFVLIISALLVAGLLAGCGTNEEVSAAAEELGLTDGVLDIAVDDTYPPMEYVNDQGERVGFDIDLAKALGEKMGVDINFISSSWEGIFTGLTAQQYDVIISSVSMTTERMETMDFSKPYLANGQVIVVKPGDDSITTKEDLAGKKVGVQIGTTSDEASEKQEDVIGFDLTKYDDIISCFNAMKMNAIDCIVVDMAVAIDYVEKQPDEFVVSSAQLTNEPIAVAMGKNRDALKNAINEALTELDADGTLTEISIEHLGDDYTKDIDMKLSE
jgi:polar amino acid transport system substrate-binding protein